MSFSIFNRKDVNDWQKYFSVNPEELAFELEFYDLYSGDEKKLMAKLRDALQKLKRSDASGPIYLIVRELLTNSLKAMYKKIYLDYFLHEMGFSDLPYEDWLAIFKTEIETHMAENFANICREKNMSVKFQLKPTEKGIEMEIVNDGTPSEVEWARLQKSLKNSQEVTDMGYLFDSEEDMDKQQEGAGLGVPLITLMLKNMNLSTSSFDVVKQDNKTIAKLFFPFSFFIKESA